MDSLILSFTPEQYKKYTEVKEHSAAEDACDITLNFDFSVRGSMEFSRSILPEKLEIMKKNALSLLSFEHKDSIFPVPFTRDEMDELIPSFFSAINEIDSARRSLYLEMSDTFTLISRLDGKLCRLCAEYQSFLPYKAALYDNASYCERIGALDADFSESSRSILEAMNAAKEKNALLQKLCDDIVPEFFASSKLAADLPKFKQFKQQEFFKSIRVFLERLGNINISAQA